MAYEPYSQEWLVGQYRYTVVDEEGIPLRRFIHKEEAERFASIDRSFKIIVGPRVKRKKFDLSSLPEAPF